MSALRKLVNRITGLFRKKKKDDDASIYPMF